MFAGKKIKILQCIRQGQIGGGESHLLTLVENLDYQRFDPMVLSFTDGPMIDRLNHLGIKNYIIKTTFPFDIRTWLKVKRLLSDNSVQLVHVHGSRANSNIIWAAKSLRIPIIYSIHGWSFHQDQSYLVRKLRVLGETVLTKSSSVNISVSASNQDTGIRLIKGFKSRVINNGINLSKFDPQLSYPSLRDELKINAGTELIVFIARYTAHKQPLSLIAAFHEALASAPDMHLLMVGDGDQKQMALQLISNLGLERNVSLLPFRQDVPAILASADIFVLPSLWEGLPIGLLEAMAMGKAVIATDVDGTKEIIENGKNGLLIPTENLVINLAIALKKLTLNPSLKKSCGMEAINTIRNKYSCVDMTRAIENIYSELS